MRIVQAGDYSPASEIYDRLQRPDLHFAFRFLKNAEAAEDAVQEVFVKMMRHANSFTAMPSCRPGSFPLPPNCVATICAKLTTRPRKPRTSHLPPDIAGPGAGSNSGDAGDRAAGSARAAVTDGRSSGESDSAVAVSGLSYAEDRSDRRVFRSAVKTRVFAQWKR